MKSELQTCMKELQIYNRGIDPADIITDRTPIEVLLQVGEDERVSTRNVYEFLELDPDNFTAWCQRNILDNEFADRNEDYCETLFEKGYVSPSGGVYKKSLIDYKLSVPFAKKLCMRSKTPRGEQARDYFIKVEDKLRQVAQRLPALSHNEILLQTLQGMVEMERKQAALESRVEATEQIALEFGGKLDTALQVFSKPGENWEDSMKLAMRDLVEGQDGWALKRLQGKLYAELEAAATCDLHRQVLAKKARLKKNGAKYKRWNFVTKLEVISDEPQLRQIFEGIVKKYQAIYM